MNKSNTKMVLNLQNKFCPILNFQIMEVRAANKMLILKISILDLFLLTFLSLINAINCFINSLLSDEKYFWFTTFF